MLHPIIEGELARIWKNGQNLIEEDRFRDAESKGRTHQEVDLPSRCRQKSLLSMVVAGL
jgi:hypothetical protein